MERQTKSSIAQHMGNHDIEIDETNFIAPEILQREDAAQRKTRLSRVVSNQIVPGLVKLHKEVVRDIEIASPTDDEIIELAHLVLSPNLKAAAAYVTFLRERGLPMETLFVELLQPAAQYLGKMWENDQCDFVDVTLGVGQLQKLLAIFNCTHNLPAINEKRRVFLLRAPGEQHSFGLAMVDKLLRAAGWHVALETDLNHKNVGQAVAEDWYAVAGISLSSERYCDQVKSCVAGIRQQSRNPGIAVMVGGPEFIAHPDMVRAVGADATATSATTAVILTQKLFDVGASRNWSAGLPQ